MNEEYKRLVEELNSLSTKFDEQSRMRMKEIAHILVAYFMGDKGDMGEEKRIDL